MLPGRWALLLGYLISLFFNDPGHRFFSDIICSSAPEPETQDARIPVEKLPRWVNNFDPYLMFRVAKKEN